MKDQVTVFSSPIFGDIRTSVTESGEPLFCLADVCKALNLTTTKVATRLEKDVLSKHPLLTEGGVQQASFVNEDGLYDVILDSRKPEAKAFHKWVTSEVLPSIRKDGGYILATAEDDEKAILAKAVGIYERTVQALQNRVAFEETRSKQLEVQTEQQQTALEAQRPIVEYATDILQSGSTLTLTQVAKALGFRSVYAFTKMLIEQGVLYRQGENLMPYAKFSGKGLFAFRSYRYVKADGTVGTSQHITITELGKKYIYDNYVSPAKAAKAAKEEQI